MSHKVGKAGNGIVAFAVVGLGIVDWTREMAAAKIFVLRFTPLALEMD